MAVLSEIYVLILQIQLTKNFRSHEIHIRAI